MSDRSRNMVLIKDSQFKPRPRPVQHASFPAILTTGCEKSQHSLRCHSRSVEDVRIKTEMLLWGSLHVQKWGKNCLKNYLKVYLKGTHIHILKPVSEHWHLCDLGFALQHSFAVLAAAFPHGCVETLRGEQKRWLLPPRSPRDYSGCSKASSPALEIPSPPRLSNGIRENGKQ